MNKKVIRRIGYGVAVYALFVVGIIALYPDSPEHMDWKDREEYNKVQIAKLELGISRSEIISLLGAPDISEARKDGSERIQVMFYRTEHKQADGITTQDECTPLLFKNDELVAWGEGAYQNYTDG